MQTLTFDWNCLIELAEGRAQSDDVQKLVEAHRNCTIDLGILDTSASENLKGSLTFPASYELFQDRIEQVGWADLSVVKTVGVWGMTYFGHAFYADNEAGGEISALWDVIAKPKTPENIDEFACQNNIPSDVCNAGREFAKWRNTWCDVHSAYSHIKSRRDIFVTLNTRDFQANAVALAELGLACILTPKDALESVQQA